MKYDIFKNKLDNRIFGDDLNYEILLTVLKNPKRYVGLFRITNAKTKLIQNLTQSCEIKFGDFLEEIFLFPVFSYFLLISELQGFD